MQKNVPRKIIKDYIFSESKLLGSGSTGCVYKGYEISSGNHVAIKVIDLETIDNQVSEYLLQMEKSALMMINNPHVLRGLDVIQQNGKCYLITQYCNGGTLKDLILKEGKLSENRSLEVLEGMLKGYADCVRKGILHRDLKPANVMLNDSETKIIDFGYCMIEGFSKPTLQYNVGSPSYMAPESYKWNMYNQKTQIWALGVTFYECLTGKTLDEGRKMSDTFKELLETGLHFPGQVSQRSKKLINWCLEYDPKRRPNCNQLLNEVEKYLKQTSQSSTQNSSKVSNILRQTSYSFLNSTPTSSVRNMNLYQNLHNVTNSGKCNNGRQALLMDAKKHEILRPRLQTRYMPETTKQNSKSPFCDSTLLTSVRLVNATQRDQNRNQADRQNKYNLKLQESSMRDYHRLPPKRDINLKTQRALNYNNYVTTPTHFFSNRNPSMTYR